MSVPQQNNRGQVIDIRTREAAHMTPEQSRQGGKREPLPRFTLTITNYSRYQEPLKRGKRLWVRFDRTTPQDLKLCRCSLEARGVFYALVMASDEGTLADVSFSDLGRLLNARPRTIESCIEQLIEQGVIQAEGKRKASASQAQVKRNASATQAKALEELANDAAYSALQTDSTDRENNPLTPKGEWAESFPTFKAKFPPVPKSRRLWKQAEESWCRIAKKHPGLKPADVLQALDLAIAEHRALKADNWETFKGPVPWINQAAWSPFLADDGEADMGDPNEWGSPAWKAKVLAERARMAEAFSHGV